MPTNSESYLETPQGKAYACKATEPSTNLDLKSCNLGDIMGKARAETSPSLCYYIYSLLNTVLDAWILKDKQGHWLSASESVKTLFRLEGLDYLGKTDREVAEYSPLYQQVVTSQMEKNICKQEEIVIVDDDYRIWQIEKIPFLSSDGTEQVTAVIFRDITKTKQVQQELENSHTHIQELVSKHEVELQRINKKLAQETAKRRKAETKLDQIQEALKKSAEKLALHIQQTPLAVIEYDLNCQVVEWNPAAEKIFGYTREEIVGFNLERIIPKTVKCYVRNIFSKLLTYKECERSTKENVTKNGKNIICEWYNRPLVNEEGKMIGVVSLAQDITERVRAEEALRESEERFRQMAENCNEVFWLATADLSELLYISPAYEKIWGRPCQSLYENPHLWLALIHPEDREQVLVYFNKRLSTVDDKHCYQEYRIVRPDGSICWIQDRCFPIRNELGKIYRLGGIAQDITEHKLVEEVIRQQTEKERVVATITQNIRRTLSLEEILNTAVSEVQKFLASDRVLIYRIWPEGTGTVITESASSHCTKILGITFPEEVFPQEFHQFYLEGQVCNIPDVANAKISPCMLDFMRDLSVKAKLVVPLVYAEELWGLLIAHQCTGAREWQLFEINLLQQLATNLTISIQQATLFEKLEAANEELQRLACLDGLTQVANRRYFDEYLEREWQQLARGESPLALILCDIDYFKNYNDTYGHQAGDDCLKQVAYAIRQAAKRHGDLVARYGGEEFAIILPNTKAEIAMIIAQTIRSQVAALRINHAKSQVSQYVTLSLGVAVTVPTLQSSPDRLIHTADLGLYEAKYRGRDRAILKVCR